MKKPLTILFTVLLLALTACRQAELPDDDPVDGPDVPEVVPDVVEDPEFSAQIEELTPESKTALDGNSVVWAAGDQIAIFQGAAKADKYQVDGECVGTTEGRFSIVAKEKGASAFKTNVAVYPYAEDLRCSTIRSDDSVISYQVSGMAIPEEQSYAAGPFASGAFLMAAVTDGLEDRTLNFKNLCGALKLQLKGTCKVKRLELEGNCDEPLAGDAIVTLYPDASMPAVSMLDGASKKVTLDCDDGVQLHEDSATDFILAIPPTAFEQGFTVTVTDVDGVAYQLSTTEANHVKRSYMHVMPEFVVEPEKPEIPDVPENPDSISILAIGNSFSVDAMQYLWQILSEVGYKEITLGNLYIGSCSLETHAWNFKNNSASYTYYTNDSGTWKTTESFAPLGALQERDWDYITMQQSSGKSGQSYTYTPYLDELIAVVRTYCPDSELAWHMTWAYQGDASHSDFVNYGRDQMTMYNAIVSAVKNAVLPNSEIVKVIPNGTAIQNVRTSFIGDNVTRDGYHLSYDKGRYLAGLTYAKILTGCDVNNISYSPEAYTYSEKVRAAIKEAVDNACAQPYEVTASMYAPSDDVIDYSKASLTEIISWEGYDPDDYVQLDMPMRKYAYYNSTDAQYGSTMITQDNSDKSNLVQFVATAMFDRNDLPDGTLIVQRSGQQYRPEGWVSLDAVNSSSQRPANQTGNLVQVNAKWWGNWNHRAFNLSKTGTPVLNDNTAQELIDGFGIFVPKGRSIVFVEGVTSASGWYDVNKMGDGTLNGDINMCWAAASANMIQWWQDRYVAAGNSLPASAVTGPGTVYVASAGREYELALMDMYHSQWNNDKGCHTAESIPWYFEGVNYGHTATAGSQAYPLTEGGYWRDVWNSIYPHLYHGYSYMFGWYTDLYTTEYTAYEHWGEGSSLSGIQRHKRFSELVVQFIDRGIASMAVTLNRNGGLNHATTVWGYEIDNVTGLLTRLWITDSDDLLNEPKEQLLNEYTVSYNAGDRFITLSSDSVRYGKCYVISLNPFSGYGSALQ